MSAMLTTIDNPFNPFTDFDKWYTFDIEKGYNSCAYLARIANTSTHLPDSINQEEIENAIDEICKININGMYKKVIDNESK